MARLINIAIRVFPIFCDGYKPIGRVLAFFLLRSKILLGFLDFFRTMYFESISPLTLQRLYGNRVRKRDAASFRLGRERVRGGHCGCCQSCIHNTLLPLHHLHE